MRRCTVCGGDYYCVAGNDDVWCIDCYVWVVALLMDRERGRK